MNLKEAFRYQNFLTQITSDATRELSKSDVYLTTTKTHFRSKANPDAVDETEEVNNDKCFNADDIMAFLGWCIDERRRLSEAIELAKGSLPFNIDVAVETNKIRQDVAHVIKEILSQKLTTMIAKESDYKFNNEGNQVSYCYDVKVERIPAYDKDKAKLMLKALNTESDKSSSEIEAGFVNTQVEYTPRFDVNDSFEDIIGEFTKIN